MKAVLRVFWFFFTFHFTVIFMTVAGLALMLLGSLTGLQTGRMTTPLAPMGNVFLIMPVLWSASVFRQLISNRSLSLVPGFRKAAVAAFALVPFAYSALILVTFLRFDRDLADAAFSDWLKIPALAYTLISAFLLLSQWACTLRRGIAIQIGAFLLAFNVLFLNLRIVVLSVEGLLPFAWFAAALLGWALLYVVLRRRPLVAGPDPRQRIERMTGTAGGAWAWGNWQPNFGAAAEPDGTLMRGSSDSLSNRVWQAAIWVLALGVFFIAFNLVIRIPFSRTTAFGLGSVFVVVSFTTVAMLAPLAVAEWPARLRYLWLRTEGDRKALWSKLERSLLEQSLIVVAIAALAATVIMLTTDVDSKLLLAYVVGCGVALPFGGYLCFWLRERALGVNVFGFHYTIVWALVALPSWRLYENFGLLVLVPCIVALAALAVGCRELARRRFEAIDWCHVRPVASHRPSAFLSREA